jgi:hypothetical protein
MGLGNRETFIEAVGAFSVTRDLKTSQKQDLKTYHDNNKT